MTIVAQKLRISTACLWITLISFLSLGPLTGCYEYDAASNAPAAPAENPEDVNTNSSIPTPLKISDIVPPTSMGISPYKDILISGAGFSEGTQIFIAGTEVDVFFEESTKIRFDYDSIPGGLIDIKVLNPDGEEFTLESAFFNFTHARWNRSTPFPRGEGVSMLALEDSIYLGTSSGSYKFGNVNWLGLEDTSTFLRDKENCYDYWPEWPNYSGPCPGPDDQCTAPFPFLTIACPRPFVPQDITYSESDGSIHALLRPFNDTSQLIRLDDDDSWSEVDTHGEVLGLDILDGELFSLTTNGLHKEGWGYNSIHPSWTSDFEETTWLRDKAFSFTVFQHEDIFHILATTQNDLLHLFSYNPGSSAYFQYADSLQFDYCCLPDDPVCLCYNTVILDIVKDDASQSLYIAMASADNLGNSSHVIRIEYSELAPHTMPQAAPMGKVIATLPPVKKLLLIPDGLIALTTSANNSSEDSRDRLYKIVQPQGWVVSLPLNDTFGLPSLPSSINETIGAIDYFDGKLYAFLSSRTCMMEAETQSSDWSPARCLEDKKSLASHTIYYLFIQNDGSVAAATDDGSYILNTETLEWSASVAEANVALRQDRDFNNIMYRESLPVSQLFCALHLPDLGLSFACTPDGVYVTTISGVWKKIYAPYLGGTTPPLIRSLAYDSTHKILYGATAAQGVWEMPLP